MSDAGTDSGSAPMAEEGGPGGQVDPLRLLAERQVLQGIHEASLSREAAFIVAGSCRLGEGGGGVRVHYTAAGGGAGAQLCFPACAEDAGFQALAAACRPASFGKGSEAVLDPGYRQALTLGPEDLLTSFSVAEHGVLSHVQRLMMPEAEAVTATLLHFNIYQQGGFFKSHVDTPASTDMFGSLVVCLPVRHAGGALRVAHGGRTVLHDWGPQSGDAIQWAAFYSDCEHEVLPVQSGARVTLTYSLRAQVPPRGHGAPAPAPAAMRVVPALHAALETAVSNPSFMPGGGTFGFPCQHTYPHTSKGVKKLKMESLLKGADAAVVATLRALRLEYKVTRVIDVKDHYTDYVMPPDDHEGSWSLDEVIEHDQDSSLMSAMFTPASFKYLPLKEEDNPLDSHIIYCAMGILVTVPPYDERMHALL